MIVRLALATTAAALVASVATVDFSAAQRKPVRLKPLVLRENCLSRAERRRAVRFTTFDRVRLIGVELGFGPRAVILAHQGGGGEGPWLCAWMRYARILALQGYRVLAFDHRGFGSSGGTTHWTRARRVDFDVLAAIQVMRKQNGAWTWAQYGADDMPRVYSEGSSALACSHCHAAGDDFVRTLELPE